MKSIWKFPLSPLKSTVEQSVEMPVGAHALSVQMQGEQACLWALVDTEAEKEVRTVQIFGTGVAVTNAGDFVGTFQIHGGAITFHVFIK